jgi:thiol-disulfide isomerase/thioredoxin
VCAPGKIGHRDGIVDTMTGVYVLVAVLVVGTVAGLLWRRFEGRVRRVSTSDVSGLLAGLNVDPSTAELTLVQFSSAFCAPCRATRQVLSRAAETTPGLAHVEVDAESHLEQVRALSILRTPTTIVVDRSGREISRIVGRPRLDEVRALVPTARRS